MTTPRRVLVTTSTLSFCTGTASFCTGTAAAQCRKAPKHALSIILIGPIFAPKPGLGRLNFLSATPIGDESLIQSPRVLVLGLDSAEPELLLRWAAEGKLLNLQVLLSRGVHAITENPRGLSGASWPSLSTGVGPGRHGRYYYSQLKPGTYRTELVSPRQVRHPPFWTTLSDAGRRVCLVDVPKTFPQKDLNGIHIVDWGNHDGDILEGFDVWPPSLRGSLEQDYEADPFNRRAFGVRGPSSLSAFVRGLERSVERKLQLVCNLLEAETWDLLYAVWDDAHWAGHFGWKLYDRDHPHHDPALLAEIGDPLYRIYVALDRAIGHIVNQLDDQTIVLVLSSQGMGPGYQATALLGPMLQRLQTGSSTRRDVYGRLRRFWDALPGSLHRPLTAVKERVREGILAKDRENKLFFDVPISNDTGAIRLNLVGREPAGKIRPGAEFEHWCDWLEKELTAVVNLDTGEPIIHGIIRTAELFDGDELHRLPDLVVDWNTRSPVYRAWSPSLGKLANEVSPWRSGEHNWRGFMLCVGPGLQVGVKPDHVRAEDFAPTVCEMLGVSLTNVDGQPVPEMLPVRMQ